MRPSIPVTSPLLPPLDEFKELLDDIWDRKWLTNNGQYHQRLEAALSAYLKTPYLSVFTNGTLPLMTALQAMNLHEGEVITTPYSFVATTHSLIWNQLTPVFVDVEEQTGNIDPSLIEAAITERTVAIMAVHVYGIPCDTAAIQAIAAKHGLKVIYDAAHAFGVEVEGESILNEGDMSTLSFHATKVYNTVEGGALICNNAETKQMVDKLKNFGFDGELSVLAPGINSKMDEIRAAYGLLNLKQVDAAIAHRADIARAYRAALAQTAGIRCLADVDGVRHNYSYFPIFIDASSYGMSRDALYESLKEQGIYARRYFYPVIPDFEVYRHSASVQEAHIPVARQLATNVLCLPIYAGLELEEVQRITALIAG